MYGTKAQLQLAIAQTLTTSNPASTPTTTGNMINFGKTFNTNLLTDALLDQHLMWADNDINSGLSVVYRTPLKPEAVYTDILPNVSSGAITVSITDTSPMIAGDTVVFAGALTETRTVTSVDSSTSFSFAALTNSYSAGDRLLLIRYPDPIPLIAVRLAAASVYERVFAAQAAPEESKFGQTIRKEALAHLDMILNGQIVLKNQPRTGMAFANPQLVRRYTLPGSNSDASRRIEKER